jgi:hypothetical protein
MLAIDRGDQSLSYRRQLVSSAAFADMIHSVAVKGRETLPSQIFLTRWNPISGLEMTDHAVTAAVHSTESANGRSSKNGKLIARLSMDFGATSKEICVGGRRKDTRRP